MSRAAAACGHPDAYEHPPDRLDEILEAVERGELTQIGEQTNAWRIVTPEGVLLAWFYWVVSDGDGLRLKMKASEAFDQAYRAALRDESGQTH